MITVIVENVGNIALMEICSELHGVTLATPRKITLWNAEPIAIVEAMCTWKIIAFHHVHVFKLF